MESTLDTALICGSESGLSLIYKSSSISHRYPKNKLRANNKLCGHHHVMGTASDYQRQFFSTCSVIISCLNGVWLTAYNFIFNQYHIMRTDATYI